MAAKQPKEKKVGTVEHYYPKVHAASVGLEGNLKLGDTVHIKGHGDDVREKVSSMQIDHQPIQEGHAGDHIGLQVPGKVHEKAEVFKVVKAPAAKPKKAAKKAPRKAAKKPARKTATKKAAKRAKKAPKRAKRAAKKAKPKKAARRGKAKKAKKGKKGKR